MVVGSRIKEERLKREMSQQQLGDLLGVTKVSVCGYENGTRTPTMETFLKLINILNIEPNYILGRDVDVVCEGETKYVKKMSKLDLAIIKEIKKYPKLYNKLCSDLNRTVELMDRRIN
ncbi:MAG: helix-turn-helix transcriptional regulator [Bacilli bacterium]|nr:helix-turn-helix transcriptional regulator [Bacilli bacterium]MCI9433827.1 helix-turn-helix transcriptional regulator [Bacilli bacterium]